MPAIMPVNDFRNPNEISDKFTKTNRIDQAIFESEKELEEGAAPIELDDAFEQLNRKYYG